MKPDKISSLPLTFFAWGWHLACNNPLINFQVVFSLYCTLSVSLLLPSPPNLSFKIQVRWQIIVWHRQGERMWDITHQTWLCCFLLGWSDPSRQCPASEQHTVLIVHLRHKGLHWRIICIQYFYNQTSSPMMSHITSHFSPSQPQMQALLTRVYLHGNCSRACSCLDAGYVHWGEVLMPGRFCLLVPTEMQLTPQ